MGTRRVNDVHTKWTVPIQIVYIANRINFLIYLEPMECQYLYEIEISLELLKDLKLQLKQNRELLKQNLKSNRLDAFSFSIKMK